MTIQIVPSGMLRRLPQVAVLTLAVAGCGILPAPSPQRVQVSFVQAPVIVERSTGRDTVRIAGEGGLIVLDTVALRPLLTERGGSSIGDIALDSGTIAEIQYRKIGVFTTYRGSRYHPESIRAITEDSVVLDRFASTLAGIAPSAGNALFLDLQEASAGDIARIVAFIRAISAALPGHYEIGVIVPAADTLGYPAAMLARVADLIVVRLEGEHGAGTAPGAPVTPDFIRRQLGSRSIGIGATRVAALFPLYGTLWERDGSSRPITFDEARSRLAREAATFRRDPTSGYLTATGRDGWSVWVPDAETVRTLIGAAASRGISMIALSGRTGADPAIASAGALRR